MIGLQTELFVDLDGDSRALQLRSRKNLSAEALAECRRVVVSAFKHHNGSDGFSAEDSFLATFPSPSDGVAAAVEIHHGMVLLEPKGLGEVSVRMGIQSGPASSVPASREVSRAARICEVANPGQIVVSGSTADGLEHDLPVGVSLRPLGSHRLRDLGASETLFQVLAEQLRADFPMVQSLDNPELPNNLPGSMSPFVGRVEELAEVVGLLRSSHFVTLTGAGGSGKTRLALQTAAEVLDGSGEGAWLVELAQVNEPSQVPTAVAEALELRVESDQNPTELLISTLRGQTILLVLDNCEHVLSEVADLVDEIRRECPKVSMLATSREPLGVDGERVYRIRSLSLPPEDTQDLAEFADSDAVQLFVTRRVHHDSTFTLDDGNAFDTASLVRRLDGIPLAIELAAAPHGSMSLAELSHRLEQRFRLLSRGNGSALPRQQTLDAMISWSYDMVTEPERAVLRRLSVFVDGLDLDAAESVCSTAAVDVFAVADILGLLVTKSLVTAERVSGMMWYSLHEVIRQFAAERLIHEDGEDAASEARRRHAEHFLGLCETAAPSLLAGEEQIEWMYRLDRDWGNILASLAFFGWEPDGVAATVRIVSSLGYFDISRGHRQPYAALQAVLERTREATPVLRCRALLAWARCAGIFDSDLPVLLEASVTAIDEALLIARQLGERQLEVDGLVELSRALLLLERGDEAEACAEECLALARGLGNLALLGRAHTQMAMVMGGDHDAATSHHLQALAYYREAGDHVMECTELMLMAIYGFETMQDAIEGRRILEEALGLATKLGSPAQIVYLWANLGIVCAVLDDYEAAEEYCRLNLRAVRRLGMTRGFLTFDMLVMSHCAAGRGDAATGAQLAGASDAFWNDVARPAEFTLTPLELDLIARNNATLADVLGRDEFDRLFARGQQLSVDKAVDLALGRVLVAV
jgi:predicted ATPase/class 3 adenylate cyclase